MNAVATVAAMLLIVGAFVAPTSAATIVSPTPEPDGSDRPAAPPAAYARDEPAVAVNPRDPDVILSAANDSNQGATVGAYLSVDGGRTFEHSLFVPRPIDGPASDPSVAFDSAGRAFVSYINFAYEPQVRSSVLVARSTDAGRTWSASATRVATAAGNENGCTFHDKPFMSIDSSRRSPYRGRIYVVWAPATYRDADCFEYVGSKVVVAWSDDAGRTFSRPRRIHSAGMNDVAIPYPTVDARGILRISFVTFTEAPEGCSTYGVGIHVATSRDGGNTFKTRGIATDCGVNKVANGTLGLWRQNSGASIATNPRSRRSVLAWSAQETGAQVVRVARLAPDGRRTALETMRQPGNLQFPWVASATTGEMTLLYLHQLPSGAYDAYLAASEDDGVTWSSPVRLTTISSNGNGSAGSGGTSSNQPFIGDYMGTAIGSDGVAHPVWTDVRTPFPVGVPNIWTRRVRI